jgi:hypothetical protein
MESTHSSVPSFALRQNTIIVSIGFLTVILAGVATCTALILAMLWGLVQVALLLLQATAITLSTIETTFTAANPTIRLIVLVLGVYGLYRAYRQVKRG